MLSRVHRMTRSLDFHQTVRSGSRAGAGTLVVHVRLADAQAAHGDDARIGFIVSRSVGAAVVRNRVRRRLRHLAQSCAGDLPRGALVVVRALPAAAVAPGAVLAADLDSCLRRGLRKAERTVSA